MVTFYVEQKRFSEVGDLAAEMLETFEAVGAPREAQAAAYLLRGTRTVEAVRKIAARFTRLKSAGSPSVSGR